MQVASILHSLDAEGSAESEAVLEEAFATNEGVVEPVEEDEAEARLLVLCSRPIAWLGLADGNYAIRQPLLA